MNTIRNIVLIVMTLIIGGLIYETITTCNERNDAIELANAIRADNKRITERLEAYKTRIGELESRIDEILRDSDKLEQELIKSKAIADSLRRENKILGEAIGSSLSDASAIEESYSIIGESIEVISGIIDKYDSGNGSDGGEPRE